MNTKRMNRLEELGRVDAEKGYTAKGKRNLKDEKERVVSELKMKKGGKVKGYDEGGKVTMTSMKKDKKKKATAKQVAGIANKMMGKPVSPPKKTNFDKVMADSKRARTGGSSAPMKAKGKKMMGGGKVKAYKKGGSVSSASKRADGIARQGRTRGRIV